MPSSGQNSASDKSSQSSNNGGSTTAGGVLLTGVNTYASSYVRKTGMDARDPIFTLDIRTGNSRQVWDWKKQCFYQKIYNSSIKQFLSKIYNISYPFVINYNFIV